MNKPTPRACAHAGSGNNPPPIPSLPFFSFFPDAVLRDLSDFMTCACRLHRTAQPTLGRGASRTSLRAAAAVRNAKAPKGRRRRLGRGISRISTNQAREKAYLGKWHRSGRLNRRNYAAGRYTPDSHVPGLGTPLEASIAM